MKAVAFAPLPARARIPPLWLQPFVAVLLFLSPAPALLLLTFAAVPVLAQTWGGDIGGLAGDWRSALAVIVLYAALLVAAVLLWTRYVERRPLETIGLRGRVGRRELAWLGAGLAWSALATILFALIPGGEAPPDPAAARWGGLIWLPAFALLLLLLAFMEEVVCRGWMLSVLAHRAGAPMAMLASGAVFACLHVLPWELGAPAKALSFVGYAAMGAGLCALALHAGQLWTPTAFHLGYNTVFVALFLTQPDASPEALWRMLESEPRGLSDLNEAMAWLAGNLLLAAAFIILWRRGRSRAAA